MTFARWVFGSLTFLALLHTTPLRAQSWQLSHGFGATVTVVYFLEEVGVPATGFVGTTAGQIFRTTDGGASWQQCAVIEGHPTISDFAFKDGTTGFFSCRAAGGRSGCYRTRDGGLTWEPLAPANDRFSVSYNGKHHRVFLSGFNNRFMSSDDDGNSWSVVGPDLNGVRFANDEFGVALCYTGKNLYTNNGGASWFEGSNGYECWNPLALAPRADTVLLPTLFAISEASDRVLVSTDGGNLWQQQGALPAKPTGDIRGTCHQLYAQSDSGMFTSNDEGATWHSIKGPGNVPDTRFFVVGGQTNDPRVFAGDRDGRLYVLRDELRPPRASLQLIGATRTISLKNCHPADDSIIVTAHMYCDATHLDSITVRASSGISVRRTRAMTSASGRYLGYDTIWMHYAPVGPADSAAITYHFSVQDYSYDSTITVRGVRSAAIELSVPESLVMQVATSCRSAHGTIRILNGRCDSVTIDSILAADSLRFRIRGLALPVTIAPYGEYDVAVDASAETQDTFYTSVRIVAELRGNTASLETTATLIVQHEGPIAISLPKSIAVQPTNICNSRLVSIPIANVGCADIVCDSAWWTVPSSFLTVLHQPTYPRLLHPDERDSVLALYHPQRVGTESAMLSWRLRPAKGPPVDTFSLIKLSSYSISSATASLRAIEFDSLRICDATDTLFYIRNESCQWTQIVGANALLDPSFIAAVPVGTWLAPGDSVPARIALAPVAPGHHAGTLSVFLRDSGGSEQALSIPLAANVSASVRAIAISDVRVAWRDLDPCSAHDTLITIRNLGICDTITFDSLWSSGSPWFRALHEEPRKLGPGDALVIRVHLVTSDAPLTFGSLTVRLSGVDTTIDLSASTRSTGPRFILEPLGTTSFHAAYCASDAHSFLLRNRTCNDVVVDTIGLTDPSFTIYPPIALPTTLPAGEADTIEIVYSATDTESHEADLSAHSGTESQSLRVSGVTTTRLRSIAVGVYAMGPTSLLPGDPVTFELRAMNDIDDSLHLRRMSAHLAIDRDMFRFASLNAASPWSLTSVPDPTGFLLTFERPTTGSAKLTSGMPLALVKCEAMLSTRQFTDVAIDRLTLNDDDAAYRACVLAPAGGQELPLAVELKCGDPLLLDRLQGLPLSVDRIVPKRHGAKTQITVSLRSVQEAAVNTRIIDMSGRLVLEREERIPAGRSTLVFDAELATGNYELVLQSATAQLLRSFCVLH